MRTGLRFDFEENDLIFDPSMSISFRKSDIESQTCALISLSQITRLRYPEQGQQLAGKLQNTQTSQVSQYLTECERETKADGAKEARVEIIDGKLTFYAKYDN